MKKYLLTIFLIPIQIAVYILLVVGIFKTVEFIVQIPKIRFGYTTNGPKLPYLGNIPYSKHNIPLKTENGDFIILGANYHKCLKTNSLYEYEILHRPTFLYLSNKNKAEEIKIPETLMYINEGLYLGENKVLLTQIYDSDKMNCSKAKYRSIAAKKFDAMYDYNYDYMAIVDIKKGEVEKVIEKKVNKIYKPNSGASIRSSFMRFGDEIILTDLKNSYMEIFNLKKGGSKLKKLDNVPVCDFNGAIVYDKDNALLFCRWMDEKDLKKGRSHILRYNNLTKNLSEVLKFEDEPVSYKLLEDGAFAILYKKYIQLFDIKNNKEIYRINFPAANDKAKIEILDKNHMIIYDRYWTDYSLLPKETYEPLVLDIKKGKLDKYFKSNIYKISPVIYKIKDGKSIMYNGNIKIFHSWGS